MDEMDGWKQRDITFFGSWVLILTLLFILRGRFWARFGDVGDSWAGLDYC